MGETGRVRADQLLVDRGLAGSRTEATRLILAGRVRLGVATLDKAGRLLRAGDTLSVSAAPPFVGRGGEKLAAALVAFDVRPSGRVCLDVGASTGGFTDCLLQAGARHVYAVDVGRGQLHASLRADARVTVLDGTNARYLDRTRLPETPDLVTVDVAFISLDKVLPAIVASVAAGAEVVALVKPQFEVGRGQVGKGGVVRDARQHREVVLRVAGAARALDLATAGVTASPLVGPRGNREFFLHLCRGSVGLSPDALAAAVDAATGSGERR